MSIGIPHTAGGYGLTGYGMGNISPNIVTKQYAIKGEMINISHSIDINYLSKKSAIGNDAIKLDLAHRLAEEMIEKKLIQFTYIDDPSTLKRVYNARCFLVPNSDVQMLRMLSDGTWI